MHSVLALLSRHPERSLTLSEIARRLDMNKATAHSMFTTMASLGLLERGPDLTYSLGREIVVMGQAALVRHRIFAAARQEAGILEEALRLNCTISIVSSGHISIIYSSAGEARTAATPLVPPFGSVFLAWSTEQEIGEWLDRAGHLSEDARSNLISGLASVRELGFHMTRPIDRVGLFLELARIDGSPDYRGLARSVRKIMGAIGDGFNYTMMELPAGQDVMPELIAMPAFGPDGIPILAVSLNGFKHPLQPNALANVLRRLTESCDRITRLSGGRHP